MRENANAGRVGPRVRQLNVPFLVSIALGLLLVGILLSVMTQARIVNAVGVVTHENAITAVDLAKDRLEHVKRLPAVELREAAGTEQYGEIPNYPEYKRTTSLRFGADEIVATVTVFWGEG
ncbi:MAG: hypothetical protein GF331_14360, partial [Chitinivibrionales bacterium]|nr:hypothetical protein [Chitinivibrionales bacterium]